MVLVRKVEGSQPTLSHWSWPGEEGSCNNNVRTINHQLLCLRQGESGYIHIIGMLAMILVISESLTLIHNLLCGFIQRTAHS